jgi:hypothetical protein
MLRFAPEASPKEKEIRRQMEKARISAIRAKEAGNNEEYYRHRGHQADLHKELDKYVDEDAPRYLNFDESHWPEKNVAAHFRTTDRERTDQPGKFLNVDEIQSDWGQKAREIKTAEAKRLKGEGGDPSKATGFYDPSVLHEANVQANWVGKQSMNNLELLEEARNEMMHHEDRYHDVRNDLSSRGIDPDDWENDPEFADAKEDYEQAKKRADKLEMQDMVHESRVFNTGMEVRKAKGEAEGKLPAAPYVQNTQHWLDLALKHIINEAARGDYDHVSFNPGQTNADMFGLHQHVDDISYDPQNKLLAYTLKGHNSETAHPKKVDPEELPGAIGKELAKKLMASSRPGNPDIHYLAGDDLKVAPDGMKTFYDEFVPKAAMKLAREHDPEVQPNPQGFSPTGGFSFPITDRMRQNVIQQGFSAFADGGVVDLGEKREEKKLQAFHKSFMGDVRERVQQMAQGVAELREQGKLPFDVGTRFHSLHTREKGQPPYKVIGHYFQPKTGAYGYHVEQGDPESDHHLQTQIAVHDPKIIERMGQDRFDQHVASYQPLGGLSIARKAGGRVLTVPGTDIRIHTQHHERGNEKILHIHKITNGPKPDVPPQSSHWLRAAEGRLP